MKRLLASLGVLLATAGAGCGPLASVACDRVGALCRNVDLAACDAQMDLMPPHVRSEILDCTAAAKTCEEAVACFTSRGYYIPENPIR
jgi:hypothetical protein